VDVSLQLVVFRLVAYGIVAAVHGWALATAAGALGDPGPGYDGRRTRDPFAQADLVGAACAVVFGLGWARPVALDADRLGPARRIAAAGLALAAVVALAAGAALLRAPLLGAASGPMPLYGVTFLEILATLATGFAVLNLVPLPPLTGAHLLLAVRPGLAHAFARHRLWVALIAAAFVASGAAARLVDPATAALLGRMLGG
jgi:Zn-dependent protease